MSNWQTATFFPSQNPTLKFSIKQMGQIAVFRYMVQILLQSTTREITLYSKAELSQCNVILRNILAHQLNAAACLPLTDWVCRLSDTLLTCAGSRAGPVAKSPVGTSTHPQHAHRSVPRAAGGACFDPPEGSAAMCDSGSCGAASTLSWFIALLMIWKLQVSGRYWF